MHVQSIISELFELGYCFRKHVELPLVVLPYFSDRGHSNEHVHLRANLPNVF